MALVAVTFCLSWEHEVTELLLTVPEVLAHGSTALPWKHLLLGMTVGLSISLSGDQESALVTPGMQGMCGIDSTWDKSGGLWSSLRVRS